MKNEKLQKFISGKAVEVDEENHIIKYVISDESRDRHGDVVKQAGWDLENYKKNPVVLFGHNSWAFPIGKAVEVLVDAIKGKTIAAIKFAVDEYDEAATAFKLAKGGYLNTTSVGFINKEREGNELQVNELLEISLVPVPANPNAFALAYETGEIDRKEVDWLLNNFQKGIDSLNKSIENKEEGNKMTEAQEKLLNETAEAVSELKAQNATILENQTKMLEKMSDVSHKKDAGDPATPVPNPDDAPVVPATTDDDGAVVPATDDDGSNDDASANADNDDAGADDVTPDTEVDPDNLSDEEARAFEAELQKQLDGQSEK